MFQSDPKDLVGKFLTKMGHEYNYDQEKKQFRLHVKSRTSQNGESRSFATVVSIVNKEWIVVEFAIADLKDAPPEISREKVYEGMLRANFVWPEVNYALYESILVSLAWSHVKALDYENFKLEFGAALSGAENFGSIVAYANQFSSKPPQEFSPIYQ